MSEISTIDALPNIPLQSSQQPPTIPKPPSPPVTRQHTARQRARAALNLAVEGSPLTYSKAKAGPVAARWLQAEAEEFDRLLTSHTIKHIIQCDQPTDRRRDTTYFNPQTKQKLTLPAPLPIAFAVQLEAIKSTTTALHQRKQLPCKSSSFCCIPSSLSIKSR